MPTRTQRYTHFPQLLHHQLFLPQNQPTKIASAKSNKTRAPQPCPHAASRHHPRTGTRKNNVLRNSSQTPRKGTSRNSSVKARQSVPSARWKRAKQLMNCVPSADNPLGAIHHHAPNNNRHPTVETPIYRVSTLHSPMSHVAAVGHQGFFPLPINRISTAALASGPAALEEAARQATNNAPWGRRPLPKKHGCFCVLALLGKGLGMSGRCTDARVEMVLAWKRFIRL